MGAEKNNSFSHETIKIYRSNYGHSTGCGLQ